jgi:hypothetical protein
MNLPSALNAKAFVMSMPFRSIFEIDPYCADARDDLNQRVASRNQVRAVRKDLNAENTLRRRFRRNGLSCIRDCDLCVRTGEHPGVARSLPRSRAGKAQQQQRSR